MYRISRKDVNTRLNKLLGIQRDAFLETERPNVVLRFGKYNDTIERFIKVFQKEFTEKQTKSMMYRLSHLEIVEKWIKLDRIPFCVSLGCYSSKDNKITLKHYDNKKIPEKANDTLIHELLHMASTKTTKYGHVTGLEVPNIIGMNLNEGYTEYLTEKYFTRGMNYVYVDDKRIPIVKGIENLVGVKKMEEFYFNADLPGLILELERYASKEDILKLLYTLDHLSTPMYSEKKFQIMTREIAKWNQRKLDRQLEKGEISEEEYDIERAIKVEEYKRYCLWSEDTEVLKDENGFVLRDHGYTSKYYPYSTDKKKSKRKSKNLPI